MEPRKIIQDIEKSAASTRAGDRFSGYAVIEAAVSVRTCSRVASLPASVGPGYTSVWHRSPAGNWTFYSTVPPEQGCSRYFGGQVQRNVVRSINCLDRPGAVLRPHWRCRSVGSDALSVALAPDECRRQSCSPTVVANENDAKGDGECRSDRVGHG